MVEVGEDPWAQWLLERRYGGDVDQRRVVREALLRVRERVLQNARVAEGETVLDVGTGDGLLAVGALERVGETGAVIFSDISQELLEYCRELVEQMGMRDQCRFVRTPAEDLAQLADQSVDVVTTRSVLIFVRAKQQAFHEFYRVLRPGGRIALFEPINRFGYPEPPDRFWGYPVGPLGALAARVRAVFERHQPSDANPMLDFDERDLLAFAERAGFAEIRLDLEMEITPGNGLSTQRNWAVFLHAAPNPLAPTLAEAVTEALSPEEAAEFTAYLRPLVEAGQGTRRWAAAYLWAVK